MYAHVQIAVDLLRYLSSIKIKVLSIYIFTRVLIRPELKHDPNKSTPPVGTEVSERLAYTNQTRPFLGWVLILQAIMPSTKRGLATRDYHECGLCTHSIA